MSAPAAAPGALRYPRLFSPLTLGSMRLRNRFAMAPLTTNFAAADGAVTLELSDYLARRARGGFGLIVTENLGVHPSGRVMPRMAMADDDRHIEGLAGLAAAVQAGGAKIVGQISHCGRQSRSSFTRMPLVAPSAIPCPINREMPRELSLDEVAAMERAFADAAVRVAAAGFDGVELHAAHGYLPSSFLSAYSNRRADRYGGSLENRMRFVLNIVDAVVARTRIPLIVRFSADELVKDGNTLEQTVRIARALQEHGAAAISVSVGVYESFNAMSLVGGEAEGKWLHLARAVRAAVSIPVLGVGRIKRPEVAERALRDGDCDIPLFGRAAIADPDLPDKTAHGEEKSILWCLGCNICLGRSTRPETICPVNPAVGRDARFEALLAAPSPRPRRIAIVGSSLSALTAAWVAAKRGHRVTLCEPAAGFGGMQAWRAAVPGQAEYAESIEAALLRARGAGVEVERGLPAASQYDLLWVTRRYQPQDGRGRYDVLAGMTADAASIAGADLAALEAALKLAARSAAGRGDGRRVVLYSPGKDVATDAHPGYRALGKRLMHELGGAIELETAPPATALGGAPAGAKFGDETCWRFPYAVEHPDAWIADAYEPGLMTRAIYEAAELAAST